jgi:Concanavalin A-like lectin/glucanases superfamily/Glycosyl hydrolase-like 10
MKSTRVTTFKIFLLTALFVCVSWQLSAAEVGMHTTGVVSHSDWLHMATVDPTKFMPLETFWGAYGVEHIIDRCSSWGMKRQYWRIFGGDTIYHNSTLDHDGDSVIDMRVREEYADAYDNNPELFGVGGDQLSVAVDYGHTRGVEVYAWITVLEENHYGGAGGRLSLFADAHQEFCQVDVYGRPWKARLSYSFSEVRAYKLAIIRELVNDYGVDGIFLDLNRQGYRDPETPSYDYPLQSGVSIMGYDALARSEYQAQYGVDPITLPNDDESWIQFRCEYFTQFLREIKAEFPGIPLVIMIFEQDSYTQRRRSLWDYESWLQEGLVEGLTFIINNEKDGWLQGGDWNDRPDPQVKASIIMRDRKRDVAGRADVIGGIYNYSIDDIEVENLAYYTFAGGADELMWWETGTLIWADYAGSVENSARTWATKTRRVDTIEPGSSGSMKLNWPAKIGRCYTLRYRDNMEDDWSLVPNRYRMVKAPGITNWTDNGADIIDPVITTAPCRFYMVEKDDNLISTTKVFYDFDDTSVEFLAVDESGQWRDGAIHDSSSAIRSLGQSGSGSSLYFDGIANDGTEVNISDEFPAGPAKITVEAWIKLSSLKAGNHDIVWEPSAHVYFRVQSNGTLQGLIHDQANRTVDGGTTIPVNQWVKVAMVYDGSQATRTVKLFVNDVEDGSFSYTGGDGCPGGEPYSFVIGRNHWDPITQSWAAGREFKGWIDDFKIIYDAAY